MLTSFDLTAGMFNYYFLTLNEILRRVEAIMITVFLSQEN